MENVRPCLDPMNGDLTIKNGDFTIKNGDLTIKYGENYIYIYISIE